MDETLHPDQNTDSPWINFSMREMPTTSLDPTTHSYIKMMTLAGKMESIGHFIDEKSKVEPVEYATTEDFLSANPGYQEAVGENLSDNEQSTLLNYSGLNFAPINSVARGFWDYDKLGRQTPERLNEVNRAILNIESAISKAPSPKEDFFVSRGTNLDSFAKYQIENLSELESMKGQFYVESGFMSTSLVQKNSFASQGVSSFWIRPSNIELRIHIPAESSDSIALLSSNVTLSPEQTEVLINRGSLSYVQNVTLDGEDRAVMDLLLIPEALYNNQ